MWSEHNKKVLKSIIDNQKYVQVTEKIWNVIFGIVSLIYTDKTIKNAANTTNILKI